MHATNSPDLRSFVPVGTHSHFPIQNLPYGVFRPRSGGKPRVGVAIGELVLDLAALERRGHLRAAADTDATVFDQDSLNPFMSLGRSACHQAREQISRLLRDDLPTLRDDAALRREALVRQTDVELLLPVTIGDYTDFYSSKEHASNVGTMFRGPENALPANWLHLPIAYHGRASSVIVGGTDVRRPCGQSKADTAATPSFGPSQTLDFELEMGCLIGQGNPLGERLSVDRAAKHVFGMVLVNDWSARDIQKWEYVPLGPFLGKNFATSISPWVVTLDALEPFRVAGPTQEPPPLDYLNSPGNPSFDIQLEVWLQSAAMPQPQRITTTNYRHLYWNLAQQVAHHTVNGCNLRTGDLLASGTISGPSPDSRGSLLEITWGGKQPLELSGGEIRRFLADDDRVTMTGWCQGPGYRVGFGELTGKVLPAQLPSAELPPANDP
ncbi:MAG TPA: fumarylacetoacetase [Pirellulales bacterium]|jgi:fumarylacetoacetase|nr:fumarylacetoacetase [Pirellulales bacterium]